MVASIQYIQNGADYYDQACRWLIKDQACSIQSRR